MFSSVATDFGSWTIWRFHGDTLSDKVSEKLFLQSGIMTGSLTVI